MSSATRAELIAIKRDLISAGIPIQEAVSKAKRAKDDDLAERLGEIVELLANELYYIDQPIRSSTADLSPSEPQPRKKIDSELINNLKKLAKKRPSEGARRQTGSRG
jgi:hypothetical protein